MAQDPLKEQLVECYNMKNRAKGLECLDSIIRKADGACVPYFILFTQNDCNVCDEVRETQKTRLADGTMREVNIDTHEGEKKAREFKIDETPVVVLVDCHGKEIDFSGV